MGRQKFSDVKLAMIAAHSVQWPDAGVGAAWRRLHEAVTAIRETVRTADLQIGEAETNRDLSDVGKLKAIGAIGLGTIANLRSLSEVAKADTEVDRHLAHLSEKGGSMPSAPTDPADVALAQEIRARLAQETGVQGALRFALKHVNDPRMVAAVAHAPAFLSGMTDKERQMFVTQAELALFPESSGDRKALLDARQKLHDGVGQAVRMIAEIAQLLETKPGEYDLKPVAKAAA